MATPTNPVSGRPRIRIPAAVSSRASNPGWLWVIIVLLALGLAAFICGLGLGTAWSAFTAPWRASTTTQTDTGTPPPIFDASTYVEPTADASLLARWPTTAAQAARMFGGSADRWELNGLGGWHLQEADTATLVNPQGFLAEGYYDEVTGDNALCAAFVTPFPVQGATIWPVPGTTETATNLAAKMDPARLNDGTIRECRVMS